MVQRIGVIAVGNVGKAMDYAVPHLWGVIKGSVSREAIRGIGRIINWIIVGLKPEGIMMIGIVLKRVVISWFLLILIGVRDIIDRIVIVSIICHLIGICCIDLLCLIIFFELYCKFILFLLFSKLFICFVLFVFLFFIFWLCVDKFALVLCFFADSSLIVPAEVAFRLRFAKVVLPVGVGALFFRFSAASLQMIVAQFGFYEALAIHWN